MTAPLAEEFETASSAETEALGERLAQQIAPPQILILRGDLGAGKTTLVKGIAAALAAADPDEVTSPTFTLVHEYAGALHGRRVRLFHLDLYRLESERQLATLGLEEMATEDSIVLVEWGEKFRSIQELADGEIAIAIVGGDRRRITLTLNSRL